MGAPLQPLEAESSSGIVDDPSSRLQLTSLSSTNEKPVLWGALPEASSVTLVLDDEEYRNKKKQEALQGTSLSTAYSYHYTQGGPSSGNSNPNSVLPLANSIYAPPVPSGGEDGKTAVRPSRDRIPLPKPKENDIEVRVKALRETKYRVQLGGSNYLPSTILYTMLNAAREVNCTAFSEDTELLAAGFADSHVQVWNLKGEKFLPFKKGTELYNTNIRESSSLSAEDILDKSPAAYAAASETHKFIGHSGPVYSVDWSFDNRFLLSGSQDSTVRLWSLETLSNLVAYRGHLGPVWSVAFSPVGFYFASGSHDKTARLWSTDEIYPLRIFAGHESDVDVRFFFVFKIDM